MLLCLHVLAGGTTSFSFGVSVLEVVSLLNAGVNTVISFDEMKFRWHYEIMPDLVASVIESGSFLFDPACFKTLEALHSKDFKNLLLGDVGGFVRGCGYFC